MSFQILNMTKVHEELELIDVIGIIIEDIVTGHPLQGNVMYLCF